MTRILWTLFLLLLTASAQAASQQRIVAIGDVHGAYDSFVAILQKASVIDKNLNWAGGNTILVQTGDILDRGPKSRDVMELLMKLEEQSKKSNGSVHVLLGNHEVMNLIGDLRYVSREEYASYATPQSSRKQQDAYQRYLEFHQQRQKASDQPSALPPEAEDEWKKTHPSGFVEHREAFAPDGKYGKWLRKQVALLKIDDLLFLHGGLSPELADTSIKTINERIRDEIRTSDQMLRHLVEMKLGLPSFTLEETIGAVKQQADLLKTKDQKQLSSGEQQNLRMYDAFLGLGGWLSVHQSGPLWFRGYSQWPEEEGKGNIDKILKAAGVKHVIVGHTVQNGSKIASRFGGKVLLIDTGMLGGTNYPEGLPSALVIEGEKFTALYMNEQQTLSARVQN